MRTILIRGLLTNAICVFASLALLRFYPKQHGFTISALNATRFFPGGVFLATLLTVVSDFLIGFMVCYRFFKTW